MTSRRRRSRWRTTTSSRKSSSSSLPRASAVYKRWRALATDPRFSRRFRAHHHRRSPPLLGCFLEQSSGAIYFEPALEAPNRVPPGRFSVPIDAAYRDHFRLLGCRHGLALLFHAPSKQLLVWDPVVGDRHRLDTPPGVLSQIIYTSATVLRPAGDAQRFQVVSVGTSGKQAVASVYSSETSRWNDLVSTQLPSDDDLVYMIIPAVMIGGSLYWRLATNAILEFHLDTQSLALIPIPEEIVGRWPTVSHLRVLPVEDVGLGFLSVSGFSANLWKRKTDCHDGVASWVLWRAIALDTLLPAILGKEPLILGFAEDNNAVLLQTSIGVFSLQLQSLEFKKLFDAPGCYRCYPLECVYIADKGIEGGHDGSELMQNA